MSYTRISPEDVDNVCAGLVDAWKDPAMPEKQYETSVKNELEAYSKGAKCLPYDAFVQCMLRVDKSIEESDTNVILEIGCSSGYYSQVLKAAGFKYFYKGIDYNPHFVDFGIKKFGCNLNVGDATNLKEPSDAYPVVVSGCCILHIKDYKKAIQEAARVSSRYVIFHRTPINLSNKTVYYVKDAYGIQCFEIHFSERELMELWMELGLRCIHIEELFKDKSLNYAHKSYLLEKRK